VNVIVYAIKFPGYLCITLSTEIRCNCWFLVLFMQGQSLKPASQLQNYATSQPTLTDGMHISNK